MTGEPRSILNMDDYAKDRELVRLALASAQVGIWDWDLATGLIRWNQEHAQLLGVSPDDFDGRYETFDRALHPDDRAPLSQVVQQAIHNHSSYCHEFRVIWTDGSIHWLEGRGNAIYDEAGQPQRMMGTLIAIDARKQAQLLQQQQLEQQRLVMEMTQRIRQSLNLRDILQTTVDEVRQFLQVDRVIIFQFAADWGGTVTVESVREEALSIFPFNIYDPCIGETYVDPFKQGLVTAKADIYNADISPCHVEFLAQFQVRANLVVPILRGDDLWGLLAAHHCTAPRPWQDSEIALLRQIASQVSVALQQSALLEQVQTELHERQQAEEALQRLNAELEQRVAERTAELTTVNDRLLVALLEQEYAKRFLEEQAQLLDLAHDTIMTRDLNSVITFWNEGAESMYGWTKAEALGQEYLALLQTQFPQPLAEIEAELLEQGYWEGELVHRSRDDRPITVLSRWVLQKDDRGMPVKLLEINNDISDRKQAEQMLALQAVITRNMAEGICLVRADNGVIVYANPKFEQMFGYEAGELNGQPVAIVNYASEGVTAEAVNQAIRAAVLQNSEATYEVHNVKKDGTPFWCSATTAVFKHPEYGDVLVAVQQDITLAKHLEGERQQAESALQQQTRQKQLLWNITQAIRQSLDLNVILNAAVTEVRQLLGVDRVAVYHFNPNWSGDFIVESVAAGWVKLVEPGTCKVWEDTYLQETQGGRFQNHETLAVADIYAADLQPCHIELLEQFQSKAYAIAPIFVGESLWGLFAIYQNGAPHSWESWEIELLQQIASQLAIALQQSELYQQLQGELQERQQSAAVIREAERRWRSLLDNVQLIVVGLDQSGLINYVNPFFLSLTGYNAAEVIGKNWFENFLPRSSQPTIQTVFAEVLTQNAHPHYKNAIVTKSGEERFIAWNNTTLQDSQGKGIGIISIGEDITEQQKVEKMKNEFISIVSHELRTPLTSIRGSLGLLATGVMDDEPTEMKRMIEIASIDTERLVRLVNDVLDLEKLENGKVSLVREWCDAADLMQRSLDVMASSAQESGVHLVIHPLSAQIWVTPDRIIQTFTNLLSNAIKFSPPGSTVTLSAEMSWRKAGDIEQIDSPSAPPPAYLLFSVHDQGRGIPADKLDTIFGRFQQVDASDSRDKGGTGLGLAICQSIVQQHGGHIWVESRWGQGSTFFFTIPMQSR